MAPSISPSYNAIGGVATHSRRHRLGVRSRANYDTFKACPYTQSGTGASELSSALVYLGSRVPVGGVKGDRAPPSNSIARPRRGRVRRRSNNDAWASLVLEQTPAPRGERSLSTAVYLAICTGSPFAGDSGLKCRTQTREPSCLCFGNPARSRAQSTGRDQAHPELPSPLQIELTCRLFRMFPVWLVRNDHADAM